MNELIQKLSEPDILVWLLGTVSTILYLTGRITKQQFLAEQMKSKGLIQKDEAKKVVAGNSAKPITGLINLLNYIPVVGAKLPLVNKSVPDIVSAVVEGPFGFLSDILMNAPIVGTNLNKKKG